MDEWFNLVDRTAMKQVISRLMDHFGIRYISHILDQVKTLGLQHFHKVNSAMNVNGVPNNPDNPDGLPFRVHFVPEQEVLEKEEIKIAEEVVVDEEIDRNQRTKTETQKKKTTTRKNILITKTKFK